MYMFNEISSFVPPLDIAAGAFFPPKKAVPDFVDMSKLRNQCFYAFLMHPMCFSEPPFKLQAQCSPFAMPVHKIKPPGTRHRSHGSRRSTGSGVKNCCSEPTSHTRRGPG